MKKLISLVLLCALSLASLSCEAYGNGGVELHAPGGGDDRPVAGDSGPDREPLVPEVVIPAGQLAGEIIIMVRQWGVELLDNDMRRYASLFSELHPYVTFSFVGYDGSWGMAQSLALNTRLLADPPDILQFSPSGVNFEKMALDTLFADFYDLFYGPRGIDLGGYFCNIFRGSETQGGLYFLPFNFIPELVFPNTRLFDSIGVDASGITAISIDEELDFFLRIARALPGEPLLPNTRFSVMDPVMRLRLYDIETGAVHVDAPQMRVRFEQVAEALLLSRHNDNAVMTPEGLMAYINPINHHMWANEVLTQRSDVMLWSSRDGDLATSVILLFEEHPNVQFSRPAFSTDADCGGKEYYAVTSYAIMRNARNPDLAWEFLRFMMEHEESMYERFVTTYIGAAWMPINRARFENQVPDFLRDVHSDVMRFTDLPFHLGLAEDDEEGQAEHREHAVAAMMDFYRDVVGQLSVPTNRNHAVVSSLVYPDMWLLHTGQQDIAQTLANIHSRLLFYILE